MGTATPQRTHRIKPRPPNRMIWLTNCVVVSYLLHVAPYLMHVASFLLHAPHPHWGATVKALNLTETTRSVALMGIVCICLNKTQTWTMAL